MTETRWMPIPGYGGLYDASENGQIRTWRNGKRPEGLLQEPRVMKPLVDQRYGHMSVQLYHPGSTGRSARHTRGVHVIVAECFIGPREPGMQVAHSDGNPANNHVSNLRYATPVENAADKLIHGTALVGDRHPRARLTSADVLEIVADRDSGIDALSLAQRFGITSTTVYDIASGRSWKSVTGR